MSATLAYTEKTRRWEDEVMERQKTVYHPTHSPLREDSEHSELAGDCVPTHDLFLKKCSAKSQKVKVREEAEICHSSTPTPSLKLQCRPIPISQSADLLYFP